jgi:hypothetical protein
MASGVMENFNIFSRRFWSLVEIDGVAYTHGALRYVLVRGESGRYLTIKILILLICCVKDSLRCEDEVFHSQGKHETKLLDLRQPFQSLARKG